VTGKKTLVSDTDPAVDTITVYFSDFIDEDEGSTFVVTELDTKTGDFVRNFTLEGFDFTHERGEVVDLQIRDNAFVTAFRTSTNSIIIVANNKATGALLWKYEDPSIDIYLVGTSSVFVVPDHDDGFPILQSIDIKTGVVLWQINIEVPQFADYDREYLEFAPSAGLLAYANYQSLMEDEFNQYSLTILYTNDGKIIYEDTKNTTTPPLGYFINAKPKFSRDGSFLISSARELEMLNISPDGHVSKLWSQQIIGRDRFWSEQHFTPSSKAVAALELAYDLVHYDLLVRDVKTGETLHNISRVGSGAHCCNTWFALGSLMFFGGDDAVYQVACTN